MTVRGTLADPAAVVFDLDGVLVTTDRCHYRAWKELADELGLPFDEERNHLLRGISRAESLKIIYDGRPLPDRAVFAAQCERKNVRYIELIQAMTPEDVLPGAVELLVDLRRSGIKRAVASASKNACLVLVRTGLTEQFDAVVDGNCVTASKPDPEAFLLAARRLCIQPRKCLGVEDAQAGIEAVHRAGMLAVGVGTAVEGAELTVACVADLSLGMLEELFRTREDRDSPEAVGNMEGEPLVFARRAVQWARGGLGSTDYRLRCLAFVEDCYEKANGIEIFGGASAHESAILYKARDDEGLPPAGAFVFYDCHGGVGGQYQNWGHVGIGAGDGKVIHAWDVVREDNHLAVQDLMPAPGWSRPKYIGWTSAAGILAGYRRR